MELRNSQRAHFRKCCRHFLLGHIQVVARALLDSSQKLHAAAHGFVQMADGVMPHLGEMLSAKAIGIDQRLARCQLNFIVQALEGCANTLSFDGGRVTHGLEMLSGVPRAVGYMGLDACNDFAWRIETAMGDFVEERAVPFMADARQHRYAAQADESCEVVVVQPGEVVHCPATPDDDDRIEGRFTACEAASQGLDNFTGRTFTLKAAVYVDELTYAVAMKAVCLGAEVAQPRSAFRRNHKDT